LDAIAEILQVGPILGHDPDGFSEAGSDSIAQLGELGVAPGAVVDSRKMGVFDESFPPGGCHRVADSTGLRANGNTQR
jgi:hypothetical protein